MKSQVQYRGVVDFLLTKMGYLYSDRESWADILRLDSQWQHYDRLMGCAPVMILNL